MHTRMLQTAAVQKPMAVSYFQPSSGIPTLDWKVKDRCYQRIPGAFTGYGQISVMGAILDIVI